MSLNSDVLNIFCLGNKQLGLFTQKDLFAKDSNLVLYKHKFQTNANLLIQNCIMLRYQKQQRVTNMKLRNLPVMNNMVIRICGQNDFNVIKQCKNFLFLVNLKVILQFEILDNDVKYVQQIDISHIQLSLQLFVQNFVYLEQLNVILLNLNDYSVYMIDLQSKQQCPQKIDMKCNKISTICANSKYLLLATVSSQLIVLQVNQLLIRQLLDYNLDTFQIYHLDLGEINAASITDDNNIVTVSGIHGRYCLINVNNFQQFYSQNQLNYSMRTCSSQNNNSFIAFAPDQLSLLNYDICDQNILQYIDCYKYKPNVGLDNVLANIDSIDVRDVVMKDISAYQCPEIKQQIPDKKGAARLIFTQQSICKLKYFYQQTKQQGTEICLNYIDRSSGDIVMYFSNNAQDNKKTVKNQQQYNENNNINQKIKQRFYTINKISQLNQGIVGLLQSVCCQSQNFGFTVSNCLDGAVLIVQEIGDCYERVGDETEGETDEVQE